METSDLASPPPGKTRKDKVVEFLDMLPIIGKPCAWVYKHWGLTGLLSFLFGLLLGLGLVFFGVAPKKLVAGSYKNNQQPSSPRVKPTNLAVTPISDPKPDWLQPYVDWLDDDAETKRSGPTRAGVGAITSQPLPRTEKFKWLLKAVPGFDLNGRAFRVTKDGYVKLLHTVKEQNSISFEVPECEEGDRIVGVVLAIWQGDQLQIEIQDTFHSTVIAGER
jgi:hypothetical protein